MPTRPCQPQSHKFFVFFHCLNPVDINYLWLVFRDRKKQPLPGRKIV